MRVAIMYSAVWVSSATVISTAIFVTGSATPVWGLIIPALMQVNVSDRQEGNPE